MNSTAAFVALKLQSNHFQFAKDLLSDEKERIYGLPGEILYKIFSDLPLQSLASVNSVSKRWNKIENNRLITLVFLSCIEGKKVFINLLDEFKSYFDMIFPVNTEQFTEFLKKPQNVIFANMLFRVFLDNSPETKVSDILKLIKHYKVKDCEKLIPFVGYLTGIQSRKYGNITIDKMNKWSNDLHSGLDYLYYYLQTIKNKEFRGFIQFFYNNLYDYFYDYLDDYDKTQGKEVIVFVQYLYGCLGLDLRNLRPLTIKEEKTFISILQDSAEKGFKDAFWKLGDFYYTKKNRNSDDIYKATEYYKQAADLKCPTACRRLIHMAKMKDLELYKEELCSYIILAANEGDPSDTVLLGFSYLNGINGFEKNIEKGLKHIEEAAKTQIGIARFVCSSYFLGVHTEKNQEKSENYFNLVKKLSLLPCGNTNPKFGWLIADLIENGHGVKKDINLAKTYHELSATIEDKNSLFTLGNYIEEGDFSFDKDLMINYYKKSADKGCYVAQFKMCQIYSQGLYEIRKDSNKANQYFLLLMQSQNIESDGMQNGYIALCFMHGFAVKKNLRMAYEFYHKAADLNHANAHYQLCIYYNQQNDFEKSRHYFDLLSDEYHHEGLLRINERYRNISYCYAHGIGTTKDEKKAAIYKQMEIDTGARFLSKTWL